MSKKVISCNAHDHFEIACMHQSIVILTLHQGETLKGLAVDLETKNKTEFLHLKTEHDVIEYVNLLDIKMLSIDNNQINVS